MSETVLPDFFYQGRVFSPSQVRSLQGAEGFANWLWRAYARCAFGVVRILSRDGRIFAGNGFVVDKVFCPAGRMESLLIATDLSPFEQIADRLCQVVFVDGKSYRARLLAVDQQAGLAIVKVSLAEGESFRQFSIKALTLVRSTSLTGLDVACVRSVSSASDALAIFSGNLRGIKVDKRIELICRLEVPCESWGSGNPLLNKQGRVLGLIRKNQSGLEKAVGAEHIRALLRAVKLAPIPDGKLLKVTSHVGDVHAKSEGIGFNRERAELPLSILGEELAALREDVPFRRLLNARLRVEIEKTVLI